MNAAPRLAGSALLAMATALSPASASAVPLSYCDFSSTAGLTLNNDASKQGSVLQLTPDADSKRGSAFSAPFPFDAATSVHTYFRFRAGPNAAGADGLVFVLQSGAANAIGANGTGLGYSGIGASFGVEFDSYDNGPTDPDAHHVSALFDGDTNTHVAAAQAGFALTVAQDKHVWIDYDASTKLVEVYLAIVAVRPLVPLISATLDLDAHLGANVRAGFTAATGGASNRHEILEWQMSTDGHACCAASPGGACSAPLPACGAKGLCVGCNADTDCGPGKPRCEAATSTCVSCLSNADCLGNAPVCSGNACVPCSVDADCNGNAAGPACSPTGACVPCTSDATCAAPTAKCDTSAHECVSCVSSNDCDDTAPLCSLATHTCVGCVDDSVCTGAKPICDPTPKVCVAGCHVVNGKDTCGPGAMCDAQDGSIGACQPVGTSSSGMASSSSGGGSGGSAGSGGSGNDGGAGGKASSGGSGGVGGQSPVFVDDREKVIPLGAGCWCDVGAGGHGSEGVAATALIIAALGARRRRGRRAHTR